MAESKAFEVTCRELESATTLSGLEARGTVRIALKMSGLDANAVTAKEMDVVLRMVLSKELALRGVADADDIVGAIAAGLQSADLGEEQQADSPEAVFSRLGG
jgi:hypothetical protein